MAITDQSIVKISGAPSGGEQVVTALPELTEFNEVLEATIAGGQAEVGATTGDMLLYVDSITKAVEMTNVSTLFDNARVIGIIDGSVAGFLSSGTPTKVPVFTGAIQSSSPTLLKTAGDFGITVLLPSAFRITVTASMLAGNGNDFTFGVYAGGVLCGREVLISGDGKDVNFSMQCISATLNVSDEIELRVDDAGNTITRLDADISVEFAGL
jgi:hypothetical protein